MNTQELLDAIKQRAEDALSTGGAWALTDRIAYIEEALQSHCEAVRESRCEMSEQELIPYFADLIKKHKVYQDAFMDLDNKAREHGFMLYWEEENERFSLSPLRGWLEAASGKKYEQAIETKQEEPQKPAKKIIAKVARVTSLLSWEVDYIFDNCHYLLNWKDEWGARPLSGNTIEIEYDEPGVVVHAHVLLGERS